MHHYRHLPNGEVCIDFHKQRLFQEQAISAGSEIIQGQPSKWLPKVLRLVFATSRDPSLLNRPLVTSFVSASANHHMLFDMVDIHHLPSLNPDLCY